MTPNARIAAAIEILDAILTGASAEQILTTWGRKNRYAGSGDRAGIRDLVFQALRCKRSHAWLGGSETGRGLMIGALREQAIDPASVFTGEGYAPDVLTSKDTSNGPLGSSPLAVRLDMPDWLLPELQRSLGDAVEQICQTLRKRADVFLRVNLQKGTREDAITALSGDEIQCRAHDLSPTAILVETNPRRVQNSQAYRTGLVELQDAASQAVVDTLPESATCLDYCAGGGGKALAIAARDGVTVTAHDIDPLRMKDIPIRSNRAGVNIKTVTADQLSPDASFDLVLCDAPCTGSGSWRRAPQAKWLLTEMRLQELIKIQSEILSNAMRFVRPGGTLAYATCSLLHCENSDQIQRFLQKNPAWRSEKERVFTPTQGGDGFYLGCLTAPD